MIRFFGGELANLLSMSSWGANITSATPVYVALPTQAPIMSGIRAHAALSQGPTRVDMVIEGEPGIGKTRLTYESLLLANLDQLVLYTNDEQVAIETAALLANSDAVALLVADECSLRARVKMVEVLKGHRSRIRLICIDAPMQRSVFDGEQPWLDKMTPTDVDGVLAANFPEVSNDHRAAYRDLSKGYIRLAIDLCQNDVLITERGLSVALRSVEDYLITRLSESQRQAAMAVALFHRVGFRDDVEGELNAVADLLGIPRHEFHRELRSIRHGPGFVAEGGRYYYVTPAVVAEALFAGAWLRWASGREMTFLNQVATLPGDLFESFLKRASINGTAEVRRVVGDHFRNFLINLDGASLRDDDAVRRLSILIEARPEDASYLRTALERLRDEEVQNISGAYGRGWGPRRTFVWLAERLARYPESFHDAEGILWPLAINENEAVGNNATAQWQQLFRVYLSGSALPFVERFAVLQKRIENARGREIPVAMGAFKGIFSDWISRTGGTVYIGGRLPPDDWQPKTYGELGDAYKRSIALLRSQLLSTNDEKRSFAKDILRESFWFLLTKGYFRDAVGLVESAAFDADESLTIVGQARDYVTRERESAGEEERAYLASISEWIEAILLESADAQPLLEYLTSEPPYRESDEEFRAAANRAARAFLGDPSRLLEYTRLASSSNPYRGAVLGVELGRIDEETRLFQILLDEYHQSSSSSLIGGYVSSRSRESPEFVVLLNHTIDELAATSVSQAVELSYSSMRLTEAFRRTLAWVSAGDLSVGYLKRFMFGVEGERLDASQLAQLLRVLLDRKDDGGRSVAVEILSYHVKSDASGRGLVLSSDVLPLVWEVVESMDEQMPAYSWADVVKVIAKADHPRAIRLAITAMTEGGFHLTKYAEQVAIELSRDDPHSTLSVFGEVLGSNAVTARFLVNRYKDFVKALPLDQTAAWLRTLPRESVRRFARHLEAPELTAEGVPSIPPLTEFVLREFEDDDEVFQSFYSGIHHLRMYSGDLSQRHAAEAAMAERFRNHPLRRVREWAALEVERGTRWSEMWTQREAEEKSEEL